MRRILHDTADHKDTSNHMQQSKEVKRVVSRQFVSRACPSLFFFLSGPSSTELCRLEVFLPELEPDVPR